MFRIPHFNLVFDHIKSTSHMAPCYSNNVNDVTAPRIYRVAQKIKPLSRIVLKTIVKAKFVMNFDYEMSTTI